MTSAWEKWKKNNVRRQETGVVRPWDFVNPETQYAEEQEQVQRMSICQECDKLTAAKTCKECGCFMPAKTKLRYSTCPVGKW